MQAKNGWLVAIIIIGFILMCVTIYFSAPEIPACPEIRIPTAAEIASAIIVPMPDIPQPDYSQEKEIWEAVYASEISELEEEALEICRDEFDMDDVEDLFDKYTDVEYVKEYKEDREIDIIDLGLDDEDDRKAEVNQIIKVRIDNDSSDIIHVECIVTSDDGDLEAELTYTL